MRLIAVIGSALAAILLSSAAHSEGFTVTIKPADPLPAVPVVGVDAVVLSPLPGFKQSTRTRKRKSVSLPASVPLNPAPKVNKPSTVRF